MWKYLTRSGFQNERFYEWGEIKTKKLEYQRRFRQASALTAAPFHTADGALKRITVCAFPAARPGQSKKKSKPTVIWITFPDRCRFNPRSHCVFLRNCRVVPRGDTKKAHVFVWSSSISSPPSVMTHFMALIRKTWAI